MESLSSSVLERGGQRGTIRPNEKCLGSLGKSRIPLATFPETGEGAKGGLLFFCVPFIWFFASKKDNGRLTNYNPSSKIDQSWKMILRKA
ncbi:hypothetical protein CEXT_122371 [Caerostris extrusa]|uniref:Uncharacterized protein n=1 Tax=Caerostris extrusa TaxID=172846 RepID=A0AAV4YBD3_CAEEX|nr:hypothetical protein CEXT_122371 [Caerostris extrusa]